MVWLPFSCHHPTDEGTVTAEVRSRASGRQRTHISQGAGTEGWKRARPGKEPLFLEGPGTCGQGPSTRPTTHRGLRGVLGQSSLAGATYVQGLGGGGQGQMGEAVGRRRQ